MITFQSKSVEETIAIGKKLGDKFKKYAQSNPLLFILTGDLGAGKTHLTKGIAKSFEVKEKIISPSFTLEHEYDLENGHKFIHMDLWRLEDFHEVKMLGLEERLKNNNVIVMEWGTKFKELDQFLGNKVKIVHIEIEVDDDGRRVVTVDSI